MLYWNCLFLLFLGNYFYIEPKQVLYWNSCIGTFRFKIRIIEPKQVLYWNNITKVSWTIWKHWTETSVVLKSKKGQIFYEWQGIEPKQVLYWNLFVFLIRFICVKLNRNKCCIEINKFLRLSSRNFYWTETSVVLKSNGNILYSLYRNIEPKQVLYWNFRALRISWGTWLIEPKQVLYWNPISSIMISS